MTAHSCFYTASATATTQSLAVHQMVLLRFCAMKPRIFFVASVASLPSSASPGLMFMMASAYICGAHQGIPERDEIPREELNGKASH